jgi:transaldolase
MLHGMDQLQAVKQFSTVVADTGDFEQIAQYTPRDATTNPSLVVQALRLDAYRPLLARACAAHPGAAAAEIADRVVVAFGVEILQRVPGRVSTEVDARLSFDTAATVARAQRLLALYAEQGIARERVLIKIAATWEGIQAARQLQAEGVDCNLTLLFSLTQAMACADARVKLISPFVGRILDWHRKAAGANWDAAANAGANDPGVLSVRRIHDHYKRHAIATEIMAASFRNTGEILALAGCDLLTISPALLGQLSAATAPVERALQPAAATLPAPPALEESAFRLALNRDAMATEKLAEGIRVFEADALALEAMIQACA